MYICLCQQITESDIEQAISQKKICCLKKLSSELGVAENCGTCENEAQIILNKYNNKFICNHTPD